MWVTSGKGVGNEEDNLEQNLSQKELLDLGRLVHEYEHNYVPSCGPLPSEESFFGKLNGSNIDIRVTKYGHDINYKISCKTVSCYTEIHLGESQDNSGYIKDFYESLYKTYQEKWAICLKPLSLEELRNKKQQYLKSLRYIIKSSEDK